MKKKTKISTKKPSSQETIAAFTGKVDDAYGEILKKHFDNPAEIIENNLLYLKRQKMTRLFTLYELFKPTIPLPGDIVELGVFRGESLMSLAKMLEAFCMGDRSKKVYGFDTFSGFQSLSEKDGSESAFIDKKTGGWSGSDYYDELKMLIRLFDADRFIPLKERICLVPGDVCETVPKFAADNPGFRISLLHFDLDLYEPTKVGLESLYERVVPGGVIIFDEYSMVNWAGESQAVDEFFESIGVKPNLKKFSWNSSPIYMFKD